MEAQKHLIDQIYRDANTKVLVVNSLDIEVSHSTHIYGVHAKITPNWIVVCTPDSTTSLNMLADPVSIEELLRVVPGLERLGISC